MLTYDGRLGLKAGFAGIRIRLLPTDADLLAEEGRTDRQKRRLQKKIAAKAEKKEKKRLKKERKKLKKKEKEEQRRRKRAGRKKKKTDAPEGKEAPRAKRSLGVSLRLILRLSRLLLDKFGKHLRIRVKELRLAVGGEDAAGIAYQYGVVSQCVAYLLALLDRFSRLRVKSNSVSVTADFLSEKSRANIKICFGISLGGLITAALGTVWGFLRETVFRKDGGTSGKEKEAEKAEPEKGSQKKTMQTATNPTNQTRP